jgi:DNA-binding beta-propeller fold protein YncE
MTPWHNSKSGTALVLTVVVACVMALYVSPALAANQIFWTDNDSLTAPISYANLDGSGGGGELNVTGGTSEYAAGMALDPATNKVYWTDSVDGIISYANLDGSGGGGQLNITGATPAEPTGLAIDPATNRVYWANQAYDTIAYANLDGSGGGFIATTGATVHDANGIAIDPANNKIYWANTGGGTGTIGYANLDGTGDGGELNVSGATLGYPEAVAVDQASNQIFWTNETGQISYASLNGGEGADLNISGTSAVTPFGLAIDPVAGKVYWADQDGYNDTTSIYYASLSGSGGGVLDTTGANPDSPLFPVLLKVPSGSGVPVVSGGSTPGSTLSCAAGTWAPDLVGSFLYQAPRSFSYSWTLNGAPLSGATSTTVTAAAPGQYACVETAANAAGSTSQASVAATVASVPPPPTPVKVKLATTKITKTTISSKHRQAKFSFKAIGTATGFQCALVKQKPHHRVTAVFSSCRSPKTYRNLKNGSYTFEVRALNAAGHGPAATKSFKIT